MDDPRNRQNDHLGVNKIGKNIRKSPLHQPNFANNPSRPQQQQVPQPQPHPQPQVYNISKNDFRSFVQQHTGSPSREPSMANPTPKNPPKPSNSRLQKVRPAPLTQINRPQSPPPQNLVRPVHFGQPSPKMVQPYIPVNPFLGNAAESPISAYMRYLQTSITNPSPNFNQTQPHNRSQGQIQGLPLPSPTSFLLSPRSPYPLSSQGLQFPPLTPNFAFSPIGQPGILGPGPQPPLSPGFFFPLSPSAVFPVSSPRRRDH